MFCLRYVLAFSVALLTANVALAADDEELYFVDAHSQMARGLDVKTIIPLMNEAGVWHTILSARNDRSPQEVAYFAGLHPERITAAVRSKGKDFNNNSQKFSKLLRRQTDNPIFKALAETILFHAKKGKKAPRIQVKAGSPQNEKLLIIAAHNRWPFVAHYEFSAAGWDKGKLLEQFEAMVEDYPRLPFVLIHMGQLDSKEARRLIDAHPNVYFMMSHSNPITVASSQSQPWVNMFEGGALAPDWTALAIDHPDRFILAFDNVWPEFWGKFYLDQAVLWRAALNKLPPKVAHALAHGNAERLWNLPPKPPQHPTTGQ